MAVKLIRVTRAFGGVALAAVIVPNHTGGAEVRNVDTAMTIPVGTGGACKDRGLTAAAVVIEGCSWVT